MKTYSVYFMIHSLDVMRGGMTRALLERALLLRDFYDEIGIITFDYNPDYDQVLCDLHNAGLWDSHLRHYNVYEFFMGRHCGENIEPLNRETFYIDPYTMKEANDRFGNVRKITLIHPETNNIYKEYFFLANGSCFFERKFDPVSGKTMKCTSYQANGVEERSFNKVKDYRDFFIRSLIEKDEHAVLLSDGRFSDRILFSVNDPKIAKVALIHSHHLQAPYQYGSRLVPRNESLIKQVNKLDAFVTLTKQQADDIRSRFGQISTIHTIGHPAPAVQLDAEQNYEPYTAVIVARYVGIKQIPHAIKAFKKVIKKVPQARLEIWGFGSQEPLYRRLIAKLKLEKHVFIKGFAENAQAVFRRAAFSVITSKSEAFAMSIIESLSVGTPVICYACHYGPIDLIKHNKNGMLIEPDDVHGLANAMIELFQNKQKRQALSREAVKIAEQFSREKTARKWVHVFEQALKQKEQRIQLKKMTAHINSFICQADEPLFFLKGELHLHHNAFSPETKQHLHLSLQLRRQKPLQDRYFPLQFNWIDDQTILFYGKIFNVEQFGAGMWDFYLSVACLNDCKFIKMEGRRKPAYESAIHRMRKAKLKVYVTDAAVQMKVLRSGEKQKRNFRAYREQAVNNYKQKLKQHMAKLGLYGR